MAKDINIHVKTTGAEQTKARLDEIGRSGKQLGRDVAAGGDRGAESSEKLTGKLGVLGGTLDRVKGLVLSFIGAWAGIQGVHRLLSAVLERIEAIKRAQQELYRSSVQLAEIGQALEFQTGTVGRQQYWRQQALLVQQAGGLASADVARQMLIAMDIAFAAQGGIKNRQMLELAKQLAPVVGAAGLGGPEVAKLFEFAGIAGVPPTPAAYKDYIAKLVAGYTASKATDFGRYMMGLQRGGTAYIAAGGTLEEAIATFVSARAVTPSEELAATLVEQAARLAGGAYEKPRVAIEQALGVRWGEMTMDQRMAAMLEYIRRIPAAQRTQQLVEAGFPAELATQAGKLVSTEAVRTLASSRMQLLAATGEAIDDMTESYIESVGARAAQAQAQAEMRKAITGERFASWQNRLIKAQAKYQSLLAQGLDRLAIPEWAEPQIIALESISADLERLIPELEGQARVRAEELKKSLDRLLWWARKFPTAAAGFTGGSLQAAGNIYSEAFEILQQLQNTAEGQMPVPGGGRTGGGESGYGPPPRVVHYYDSSIHYHPRVGPDERGPRFEQFGD